MLKFMDNSDNTNSKDNNIISSNSPNNEKPFQPKNYRPWHQIELTEEQKENVRRHLDEEEKRLKKMSEVRLRRINKAQLNNKS